MTTTTAPLEFKLVKTWKERDFLHDLLVSACGLYAIEHVRYTGEGRRVADVWHAMEMRGRWRLISEHRKRGPAEAACEKHAREA